VIILIPCKALDQGKSRLSSALDVHARRALCEFFLCRTLAMACALVAPAQIYVVTADPQVAEIAGRYGASVLSDSSLDLNGALEQARAAITARHADMDGLLIMPIDLPLSTPGSLLSVVAELGDIVLVPDEGETGTNLLLLRQASGNRISSDTANRSRRQPLVRRRSSQRPLAMAGRRCRCILEV